jgi:PE-PPE domain
VLIADLNLPNGGIYARFPGLYVPILDWYFDGPAPTDTQFDTVEITRQYDWFADFPLYPINLVADLNAFLGIIYVHDYALDVSLPQDPTTSPAYQGTHGDTDYYFFETQDLPLFGPLRTLGVPESVIDVVEPIFQVIVELGYDRSIPPWEPTPARLIPMHDPATVAGDLFDAIGEGVNNAAALLDSPPPLSTPAVQTTETVKEAISDVRDGVSPNLTAVGSQPPQPPNKIFRRTSARWVESSRQQEIRSTRPSAR